MPELVYLSLGSNLGDRASNLRAAIDRLATSGVVTAVSRFYETEPVDVPDQPWFLNCVLVLGTESPPRTLLSLALCIEGEMGRLRTRHRGPRTIDIDILLFGDRVVEESGLRIPHPSMHQRRFVLEPLVEIAPDAFHPLLKKTARELLAKLTAGPSVRPIAAGS